MRGHGLVVAWLSHFALFSVLWRYYGPDVIRWTATRESRRPLHTHPLRSPHRYKTLDRGGRAGTGTLRASRDREESVISEPSSSMRRPRLSRADVVAAGQSHLTDEVHT